MKTVFKRGAKSLHISSKSRKASREEAPTEHVNRTAPMGEAVGDPSTVGTAGVEIGVTLGLSFNSVTVKFNLEMPVVGMTNMKVAHAALAQIRRHIEEKEMPIVIAEVKKTLITLREWRNENQ